MRGRLYATTALITRDGPLEPPGGDRAVAVSQALSASTAGAASKAPPTAGSFSDTCLCSDGEIYLKDEDHLEQLLRGPV